MKREYVKPMMVGEQFVPNEYIAACGETNKVYKFTCNGGGGAYGDVYLETNGVEGLQRADIPFVRPADEKLTFIDNYHACGAVHEAPTDAEFPLGYFDPMDSVVSYTKVRVWTAGGTNVHCTEQLDISTWETTKS